MNSIAYEEYINKIESSISYNRQQFFPMDKKLRRERILKLEQAVDGQNEPPTVRL
jgi:hypothetical protein